MLQTAYGSLFEALQVKKGETLLIRGGTISVGLAAAAIAKNHGVAVVSTTRKAEREALLKKNGSSDVFIDDGHIADNVKKRTNGGVDKVLELIGTTTLLDSLQCTKDHGVVCMTGIVGNSWTMQEFSPMGAIPTGVRLTTYAGGVKQFMATPLQEMVEQIESGTLHVTVGKTFNIDEIVEAHRCMDEDRAGGKIVVLT